MDRSGIQYRSNYLHFAFLRDYLYYLDTSTLIFLSVQIMKTKILSIFLLLFFGAQFAFAGPEDCVVSPQGGSDIKDVLKKCQSDGSVKIDKGGDDITSVKIYVK